MGNLEKILHSSGKTDDWCLFPQNVNCLALARINPLFIFSSFNKNFPNLTAKHKTAKLLKTALPITFLCNSLHLHNSINLTGITA